MEHRNIVCSTFAMDWRKEGEKQFKIKSIRINQNNSPIAALLATRSMDSMAMEQ